MKQVRYFKYINLHEDNYMRVPSDNLKTTHLRMKKILLFLCLLIPLLMQYSCKKSPVIADFKDMKNLTIYDYLVENKSDYSSFLTILEQGGIAKTLSAYNPKGTNYTLFLPDNKAVDNFLMASTQYHTLDDIVNDKVFVAALARYHVLNMGSRTYEFPFGTFSESTLSGDFLNVNFLFGKDTTYYNINNQAKVIKANIELSNGYIQVIGSMLNPITMNSYTWLKNHPAYSILTSAIETTGINKVIDVDMKLKDQTLKPFTILVEPDTIYQKRNINSFADLAKVISPDRNDYTNSSNPMNLFAGYHILTESKFLNDLQGRSTNYNTFADVPLNINGNGLDIIINRGKEIFDTKISGSDTTIIDYVGINYDASNVITQSGAIHFIDQILTPQVPSRATVTFEFSEELALNDYRQKGGTFLIENPKLLEYVTWTGAKLFYVRSTDPTETASGRDYMQIDGDFTMSYQVPKIIQGRYTVYLRANAFNPLNALVELYVDGNKLGGLIDLTKGGSASYPYVTYKVGAIDLKKYDIHTITIKSLIPGSFIWDFIRFEPL